MKYFGRKVLVVMLGVALAVSLSACKTKKPKGSADGSVSGVGMGSSVAGSDMYGPDGMGGAGGLPERPGEGLTVEKASQFSPVYFDYDSSQVKSSERSKLDPVVSYLKNDSAVSLIIEGNTDERGSSEYNLSLGERRALAIRAYLVGLGVDGSRLQTKSNGKEKPVANGHDEASWAQNRRAEFFIMQ